jgi:hypothetical protein
LRVGGHRTGDVGLTSLGKAVSGRGGALGRDCRKQGTDSGRTQTLPRFCQAGLEKSRCMLGLLSRGARYGARRSRVDASSRYQLLKYLRPGKTRRRGRDVGPNAARRLIPPNGWAARRMRVNPFRSHPPAARDRVESQKLNPPLSQIRLHALELQNKGASSVSRSLAARFAEVYRGESVRDLLASGFFTC